MVEKKKRKFISEERCIYSGIKMEDSDENLKKSVEHIIPLSVGGSNAFVTRDVSVQSNNTIGARIDKEFGCLFLVALQRNKYKLTGHRGAVPDIKIDGKITDISSQPHATMIVDKNGEMKIHLEKIQHKIGEEEFIIHGDENWVKYILEARLKQALSKGDILKTPYGSISKEEDIKAVIDVAPKEGGSKFQGEIRFSLDEYHKILSKFIFKIALCIGHITLGPAWTFGPDGNKFRSALNAKNNSDIRVTGSPQVDTTKELFISSGMVKLAPNRHTIVFSRIGNSASVLIALFGGCLGVSLLALSLNAKKYRQGKTRQNVEAVVFSVDGFDGRKSSHFSKNDISHQLQKMIDNLPPEEKRRFTS
ncbi:hypothetical protein APT_01651 [Acetobacter pasteurianus NBRC 101655]|uniref:hypothetical protein n=1 Tax=Acetobacter pasteurianus TaxID=438 RepID=UPI00024576F1|nr:hypothetical protein [Acetobacter pasteurianus]BAU38733.1 hypothetical protein APT_01651 [Acetobacter pasteurianus NBRC 101655]